MSRLTKRVRCDVSPMILKLLNIEEAPEECIEIVGTDSKTCDEVCEENQCQSCVLSAVFEKLAHYEDMEEQGRLIEQKHGTWIPNKHMTRTPTAENYHCSECTQAGKRTSYCPHCGAKMKLKELEGDNE